MSLSSNQILLAKIYVDYFFKTNIGILKTLKQGVKSL